MKLPRTPARCQICGKTTHVHPGSLSVADLFLHHITEWRDCPHYEDCLTIAAETDAVMVPCIYCSEYPIKGMEKSDD
jgi:hypothetical protein